MTKSKLWNYALVQHPMWLIIAEDSVCAERTPPWGAETLEDYAGWLRTSLDALEKFPQLHLNFDLSAAELILLNREFPDLGTRMRDLSQRERVSFVNGTYSQPHLQILSVESAIRQFEYGLRIIEELTGYRVRCYAAQEPGLTAQLPQMLTAMGFNTATTTSFPSGVRLFGGQVQHWDRRWEWLEGDDLLLWRGLDGTELPLWLKTSGSPNESVLTDDQQHGLLNHTRLRVEMPDMVEVSPKWMQAREEFCHFVQLDRTLEGMFAAMPPEAIAQIDPNYAYLEGVDAEELARANTTAETALLSLEAIDVFFSKDPLSGFDVEAAWKTFLEAQHHDAYWIGAPELRAKSISRLRELTLACEERLSQTVAGFAHRLPPCPPDQKAVMVVHPYPRAHGVPVALKAGIGAGRLSDHTGTEVPAQLRRELDGTTSMIWIAPSDGLAYSTLFQTDLEASHVTSEEPLAHSFRFSNDFYSASVAPDATVQSLAPKGSRSLAREGSAWTYQDAGEDLLPRVVNGSGRLERGPVFDAVEAETELRAAKLATRIEFYHSLPWFRIESKISFDEPAEIGDYFDDRTKLHYRWHVGPKTEIRHALGGCPAKARPRRTFLVNPWLSAKSGRGGIAFCLFNATKCWLDEDGYLRLLAAWGHNGDHFHNRQGPLPGIMGPLNWLKPMDLRLRDTYTIRYAVWPHGSTIGDGAIADWAASLLLPPIARRVETGMGEMPWSQTLLSLKTPGVLPLSLRPVEGGAVMRLMESDGAAHRLNIEGGPGWRLGDLRRLDGSKAARMQPYKILSANILREDQPCTDLIRKTP